MVVISVGAIFIKNLSQGITDTVPEVPKTSLGLIIAVAVFAFLISFMGCCGAAKESYSLLFAVNTISCILLINLTSYSMQYGWIIMALLIVEFVAAVLIYRFRSELKNEVLEKGFENGIREYHNKTYEPLDDVQKQLECCGGSNYTEWGKNAFLGGTYPPSCCGHLASDSPCAQPKYTDACIPKLVDLFQSKAITVGGAGIAVAVFQLLAVFSACCLARAFKREYEVV